jgi:hypothetical protein
MAKRNDKVQSDSQNKNSAEKAQADAAPGRDSDAARPSPETPAVNLPVVAAPQLGSGEEFAEFENESEASEAPAGSARQPRSFRFALLAATIALAAGIGSFLGSLTASGVGHDAAAAIPRTADARGVVVALKAQVAELSRLRSSLESSSRSDNAQFARITTRLDSLERAQAQPSTQLMHIANAVDRLEKRARPAADITGSIPARPVPDAGLPPGPVLSGWIVRDVRNGRAMVESRYGGVFVVGSGGRLPGLGRVEEIKRQDGHWRLVTASGVITSPR